MSSLRLTRPRCVKLPHVKPSLLTHPLFQPWLTSHSLWHPHPSEYSWSPLWIRIFWLLIFCYLLAQHLLHMAFPINSTHRLEPQFLYLAGSGLQNLNFLQGIQKSDFLCHSVDQSCNDVLGYRWLTRLQSLILMGIWAASFSSNVAARSRTNLCRDTSVSASLLNPPRLCPETFRTSLPVTPQNPEINPHQCSWVSHASTRAGCSAPDSLPEFTGNPQPLLKTKGWHEYHPEDYITLRHIQ